MTPRETYIEKTRSFIETKIYNQEQFAKYCAIIIDSRSINDFSFIIKNHLHFLGNQWGLLICTSKTLRLSLYEQLKHLSGTIEIKPWAEGIASISDYNKAMTDVSLWRTLAARYEKILIFQHDSLLLRSGIDEFMEWDYVGAPWAWQESGGNGGLSLRNPKKMIEVIERYPYNFNQHGNEDVYYSNHLPLVGGRVAPREVCRKFSCEAVFALGSMGVHAIEKYLSLDQIEKIYNQYNNAAMILSEQYVYLCGQASDINELLPILKSYAEQCEHITEMGTRQGFSTVALLMGRPKRMIAYDLDKWDKVVEIENCLASSETIFSFHQADVLQVEIEETDLLFIDTFHTATQLERELALHAKKVRKFLIFHDTTTFWEVGGQPDPHISPGTNCGRGLRYAIEPFLAAHPEWKIKERFEHNNGLLILQRVA